MVIKGLKNLPCEEKLKELGLLPMEKSQGRPRSGIPVFKEQLQTGQRLSFHKKPHGEDKLHQETMKNFFYCEKNNH